MKTLSERLHAESQNQKAKTMHSLREKMLFRADVKKKKLTPEEQEQANLKLYNNSIQRKENLHRQVEAKYMINPIMKNQAQKLDNEQMQTSVEHLYTNSMQLKDRNREKLRDKYIVERNSRTLDEEEMHDSLQRLVYDTESRKKESMKKLRDRYLFKHPYEVKPKLAKDVLEASRERLCNIPKHEQGTKSWPSIMGEKTRQHLTDLYLTNSLPQPKKKSESEWNVMLGRLYVQKS